MTLLHFLHDDSIGSNLTASGLWVLLVGSWGYVKVWKRHIQPHIAITREIHAHLKTHDSRLRVVQTEIEKETP